MFTNSLNYYLACFFFNTFPIPQREAGARHTLQYIGEVTGGGMSILLFPEGVRSPTGQMKPFRGGIGMIASRLDLPVVPVKIEDVDRADAGRVRRSSGPGGSASRSARRCACAATTTPRWPRRSRRRCGTSDQRSRVRSDPANHACHDIARITLWNSGKCKYAMNVARPHQLWHTRC